MDELTALKEQGLLRNLRVTCAPAPPWLDIEGKKVINFSSNDYLGFSQHPSLVGAATDALKTYGAGSTASRLVCGSLAVYHALEAEIARIKKTEAALTFANGYATAMGIIPAIVRQGDTVIIDKLAHACLIDAARLSGATLRVYPHNDLRKLARLLEKAQGRTLIVTESVFSMDGDLAPLREICELKKSAGALLLVDEAHAMGVLGENGFGLAHELGLQKDIDFQMGTFGKALGSAGGYLAATQDWIDLFINKARSFIYSTAPPPSQAAASLAALRLLQSEEGQSRRNTLIEHMKEFDRQTPIIPIILGENETALSLSQTLLESGFLVPAIRFPTVPRGTARLRLTLSAMHSHENIQRVKTLIHLHS